jgi:hypothetical protein
MRWPRAAFRPRCFSIWSARPIGHDSPIPRLHSPRSPIAWSCWQPYWYRTSAGAEIDLLLIGRERIAIEVKRSTAPAVSKGFHNACDDVGAHRRWVIYPGRDSYPGPNGVQVLTLTDAMTQLAGAASDRRI